jgi:hypothetical protein
MTGGPLSPIAFSRDRRWIEGAAEGTAATPPPVRGRRAGVLRDAATTLRTRPAQRLGNM